MVSSVSFGAAFAGLEKGVESARKAGAELAKHSQLVEASTESSSDGSGDGKGSIIDVTT